MTSHHLVIYRDKNGVIAIGLVWFIRSFIHTRLLMYSTSWTSLTSARTVEPSSLPTLIARILKSDLASRLWSHAGRPWKVLLFTLGYPGVYCGWRLRKATSDLPMCAGAQTRGAADAWSSYVALMRGSSAGCALEAWQADDISMLGTFPC